MAYRENLISAIHKGSVHFQNQNTLESADVGDILEFQRGLFSHYGVYIGNDEVVHLTGKDEHGMQQLIAGETCTRVKKDHFWTVAGDSSVEISNKDSKRRPVSKRKIVQNALSRLGRVSHNLIYKTSEHFANWCRYEEAISDQPELTGAAVLAGLATVGALAFMEWMTDDSKKQRR